MQLAVADAKARAEVLAEAAGLKITGIKEINENGVYSYDNGIGNVYAKSFMAEETAAGGETVVQSAKLIVSANVSITFEAE